ncbi:MAG: hypothetical protein U5K51_11210 [Flavobacteriaceae bacterium]|nr:hypothetical protein [Flavobacteriaceae bacterium]
MNKKITQDFKKLLSKKIKALSKLILPKAVRPISKSKELPEIASK